MGTINEMDLRIKEYINQKMEIDLMHLILMDKIHTCKIKTNVNRVRIIGLAYATLYFAFISCIVLCGYFYS